MKKSHNLSFATIIKLDKDLAEVIVNEGVVIDEYMTAEYHDFLQANLTSPFYLLINKKHSYSYTFEAQKMIANLPEIKAMAVVVQTFGSIISTEALFNVNENKHSNVRIFEERKSALKWLKSYANKE